MDTVVERSGGRAVLSLRGDVVVWSAGEVYRCLEKLARERGIDQVSLDLAQAGRLDSSGVAAVSLGRRLLADAGKTLELVHLSDRHRAAFALLTGEAAPAPARPEEQFRPPPRRFERTGEGVVAVGATVVELGRLLLELGREALAVALRRRRMPAGALTEQAAQMGASAFLVVGLLSFLLGITLAFQAAFQLSRFGASVFVADLVGLAMVREFGPMMTAIILTGRSGASIAAELGTMRVREEVDALRAMGVSPIRYLVLPRLLALLLVEPALSLMAMFIGVAGGMLMAAATLHLEPVVFWNRLRQLLVFSDFVLGLVKSTVFAAMIGVIACFTGLRARGGAQSVGVATTRTVVASIFAIIVVDAGFAMFSNGPHVGGG